MVGNGKSATQVNACADDKNKINTLVATVGNGRSAHRCMYVRITKNRN
jgi:hypothetical protein